MSVKLVNSATAAELGIESTSRSARITVYDANGNDVVYAPNAQPSSPRGLLNVVSNDGRMVPMRADRFGSVALATRQSLMEESFEGTVTNPIRWLITSATMAAAQTTVGGLVFNSASITTISTGYMVQTSRRFMKNQRGLLHFKCRARLAHIANSVIELGFADAPTNTGANTTGAYFQVTSAGVLQGVVTYNGVDTTTAPITFDPTKYYTFDIYIDDDQVDFYVQDTSTESMQAGTPVSIKLPLTAQRQWSATQLPIQARLYNTGSAPASAPQLLLTDVSLGLIDNNMNLPVGHVQALQNRGSNTNPFTGAQTPQYTNILEPTSATLSNTSAGYTTLGGKFQFAAPAGAVTDFALFGYQVPVPSSFVITGISIDTWNTGAASATTPTLLTWALGVGSTAVSLATATVTRIPVGSQSIPVGAAIGANVAQIQKTFSTPLVCEQGRFIHVILRVPVGTATASQVIAGMVVIEGYSI